MKVLRVVSIAILGMTASVALAGTSAPVERLGRSSQIQGGGIAVKAVAADPSAVYGRGSPAMAMQEGKQRVIAAQRSAGDVLGRA
ncbi:MAG TPA: hypothetical protein VNM24_15550 [Burkholderiales bacterium]|nr:hypothetical protein [Burkholderiales bacterium]